MMLSVISAIALLHGISTAAQEAIFGPQLRLETARGINLIKKELGPLLSKHASIVFPTSPDWKNDLMTRASSPRIDPGFLVVVEVAVEEDVQETIKNVNRHDVPFLAVSGAHGWQNTLNNIKGGIQINMCKMNATKINPHGKTANVGGGTIQYEVIASLFEQGKQAVTGICECVSAIWPLLGGGHSMLQGRHGFAADNLVSARVVLADGKAVTTSADENPDLFWVIRGAGQNFGVVTSFELKVYEAVETWTMVVFGFTQDKLEDFFRTWNQVEADHPDPGLIVLHGTWVRNPNVDAHNPPIKLQMFYEGENPIAEEYVTAFRALGPTVDKTVRKIPWGNLFDVGDFSLESPNCRKNGNIFGCPNSFTQWDPQAMRNAFEIFSDLTADEVFAASVWLLESFGRKGVEDVPNSANAVAPEERVNHTLMSPILWWAGDDEQNRQKAAEYGERMQVAARGDAAAHMYLNYCRGDENLQEVYGRDKEGIAKLKRLKRTWDPLNRFGFYMPLEGK